MSAPIKRVVGWISSEEWESVYKELFSDDQQLQRHAVGRIAVWKCRLQHRLSAGIECTWQLFTAQLCDRGNMNSEETLKARMAYSVALVRFVNLLTEKGQTKMYAQPIHTLAEELGLPEWLVDLRHEATHSSLPSLTTLRTGAAVAINWLKTEFWDGHVDPEFNNSNGVRKNNENNGNISSLLADFIKFQIEVLDQGSDDSLDRKISQILSDVEQVLSYDRESVMDCLVQEGCLCPTREQMKLLQISNDLKQSKNLLLPDPLVRAWKPLLKVLVQKRVISILLHYLLAQVSDQGTPRDRLLMGWVATFIESLSCREKGNQKNSPGLSISGSDVDEKQLVDQALEQPNIYTYKLLKCLFKTKRSGLSTSEQQNVLSLLRCYATDDFEYDAGSEIYSVEHITGIPGNEEGDLSSTASTTNEAWSLDSDILDWSRYPIGACPGRGLQYRSFDLPAHLDNLHTEKATDCNSTENAEIFFCQDSNYPFESVPKNGGMTESFSRAAILKARHEVILL